TCAKGVTQAVRRHRTRQRCTKSPQDTESDGRRSADHQDRNIRCSHHRRYPAAPAGTEHAATDTTCRCGHRAAKS
ncbi:Nuclease associated modular domain-containing protein, partial [Dysosmobacter welbionis]